MSTRTWNDASRTEASHDGDRSLGDDAKQKGQEIGQQAKGEMQNIAGQLRRHAKDEVDSQTRRSAEALRGISRQMHSMAEDSTEKGRATDLAQAGAERVDRIADRLEQEGLDGLRNDVEDFARRRPGLFLAAGVGVGMALGRLFRTTDMGELKDAMSSEGSTSDGSHGERSPESTTAPGGDLAATRTPTSPPTTATTPTSTLGEPESRTGEPGL